MSKILLITINETLRIGGVLTTATLGDSYFARLTGYAGIEPYVWTITGALPTGISASVDSNGDYVFSGTPSTVGTFPIVVTLTDSEGRSVQRSFDFKSAALPLTISGHLPNATVGGIASFAYTISGGYGAKTVTLYSGTLPTGISVSSAGVVSGTYTAGGTFSWRLLVTDSLGSQAIVVDSNTVAWATLAKTGALTNADIGDPVGGSITLSGGDGTYTVDASPVSGTRPPGNGLTLVGAVYSDPSGVTTTVGSYSWTDRFHSGDGQLLDVPTSLSVVGDPYWSDVLILLNAVGVSGSTTMVNSASGGSSVYSLGTPAVEIDTTLGYNAIKMIGGGWLSVGGVTGVGAGPFTAEMWVYIDTLNAAALFDGRPNTVNGAYPSIYTLANGTIYYFFNNTTAITSSAGAISASALTHVAVARDGSGNTRLFIGGTQVGSTYVNSASLPTQTMTIGANGASPGTFKLSARVKAFRFTKACRYTTAFTPEPAPWLTA